MQTQALFWAENTKLDLSWLGKIAKSIFILSQMVTYLVCDELKYGFKSTYEQS